MGIGIYILLAVLVLISPLLILIAVIYLGRHLLKRKINPNEVYLNEIKKLKLSKILNFVNVIIVMVVTIIQNFNNRITLLLTSLVVIELIRNKYILSYLKTKDESNSTRKYILYDLYIQVITSIVVLGLYFLCFKFLNSKI